MSTFGLPTPVKTYCITFGVIDVNLNALTQYLYDSADIIAFWNYVPLVFCVKSRLDANALAIKLAPFFPSKQYFICEVNTSNINGMLPPDAWDWFYLQHHQKAHPPLLPAPSGAILPQRLPKP